MKQAVTIYLCDDEEDVRGGLSFLLRQLDFEVRAFEGGREMLAAIQAQAKPLRAIFVLDLHNPPMDGDAIHDELIAQGFSRRNPVIFLSGHGTIPRAVAAMGKGALGFIEKPHTNEALVPLLQKAVELEAEWNLQANRVDYLESLWQSLSGQQKKVALLVADGDPNKVIADKLGIVERTVEVHRSKVLEKLGVDSAAALATTIATMKANGIVKPDDGSI